MLTGWVSAHGESCSGGIVRGLPGELMRSAGRGARSAQRELHFTQGSQDVLPCGHAVEHLAYADVIRMSSGAEAETGPAPDHLLRALDDRSHLGAACRLGERIQSRTDALKGVRQSLPYSPADLCESVCEIGVLVCAHDCIFSPGKSEIQAG